MKAKSLKQGCPALCKIDVVSNNIILSTKVIIIIAKTYLENFQYFMFKLKPNFVNETTNKNILTLRQQSSTANYRVDLSTKTLLN